MEGNKYLRLKLDGEELDFDVSSDFPISFDYQLEDVQDFQKKKSSESLAIKLPATLNNQRKLNGFHNTSVEDTSVGKYFRSIRKFVAETGGIEIFVGKAIPKRAYKKNGKPTSYELNAFGNNADWLIDMKDVTLYDILKRIEFDFSKQNIINSWGFDGRNENLPYVFAPVKYAGPLDPEARNDKNYHVLSMKPSISKFWTIYWAFQMLGYRVKSDFLDTDYYRRQVMPWTWGAFLTSEGTKYDIHKFRARSTEVRFFDGGINEYVDLNVLDATPGFDNNNTVVGGDYNYDTGGRSMNWKYNTPDYGPLDAMFSCMVFYNYNATAGSNCTIKVHWFKNGNLVGEDILINSGENQGSDVRTSFRMFSVNVTDQISCKVLLDLYKWGGGGIVNCELSVDQFQVDYFRVPIGGQIAFDSYLSLQKYKFLDFLKGEVDLFNLNFQTDPTNKEVVIEPAHEYFVGNDSATKKQGYFSKNTINWSSKEDVSFESIIDIYDDNEREFVFKFKDDSNDGALKIVQDRYKITLAAAKYVFDERFKAEKKPFENRFYAATMHYLVDDFSGVTGEAPQMICLVPENISNTSSSEAQNTFIPKTAYYKGLVTGVGGWVFDGDNRTDYPFMFAVNYKQGGENDPILSYSDEKIGKKDLFVVGTGLLKRFFWQRLAIMNNGQWLTSKFNLNNTDITNWYHRERIDLNGELWELISIKNFIPGKNDSTKVMLRKWYPITEYEDKNTYPSKSSILTDAVVVNNQSQNNNNEIDKVFDTQYNQLMCLYGDIPR